MAARAEPGCAIIAMVNGYGHGALTTARAAVVGGATWLGVSSTVEAVELRRAGVTAPVLNVGWTMPSEMATAVAAGVDVAVFSPADVDAAASAARGGEPGSRSLEDRHGGWGAWARASRTSP